MKHTNFICILFLILIVAEGGLNAFQVSRRSKRSRSRNKDEKYDTLYSWAVQNGAKFNKFKIKYLMKDNRFGVAQENIDTGDNIVTIPEEIIITEVHPLVKPTCEKYKIEGQKCMATYMCSELKNQNNFFKAYFDFLPNDFQNYPAFFTKTELNLIKGSTLMEKRKDWHKWFHEEYTKLKVTT